MKELFRDIAFKVQSPQFEKSKKDGKRVIRGYASTDNLDRQNEIISMQALEGAKADLLSNVTVFMEHQHSMLPIGLCVDCVLDEKGLFITVELSKAKFVDDIWTLIEEKILNSFSIGGVVLDGHDERSDDGKSYHVIDKISILEVSVVGLPANPEAKFEPVYKSFTSAIAEQIKQKEGSIDMEEQDKKEVVKTDESQEEVTKVEEVKKDEEVVEDKKEEVEKPKIDVEVSVVAESEKVEESVKVESKDVVEAVVEVKEVVPEVVAEVVAEVVEVPAEEGVVEKSKEASPKIVKKENEEVEIEDEDVPAEKSTDEKILDALALIIEKLSSLDKKEVAPEIKADEPEAEKAEDDNEVEKEDYECECLACGEVATSTEHCKDIKCSKCGGEMRRKDRPGVGKDEEVEETKAVKEVEVEKKEEVKIEKEEEPKRKGLAVVVPSPYEETEKNTEGVKKTSDEGWKKVFFGR